MIEKAIARSHFTLVKFAAIIVVIAMIAAVAVQATVVNVDRDQLGSWSDSTSSKSKGVVFHALVDSDKKVSKDCSITLRPVCDEGKIWRGSDPVIGDDVFANCRSSKNKGGDSAEKLGEFILSHDSSGQHSSNENGKKAVEYGDTTLLSDEYGCKKDKKGDCRADISAEEITLNIVGQFSNSDSSRASFSQLDMGKRSGRYAGLDDNDSLKVVLKSCDKNYGTDKSTQFADNCYDRGHRWKGGNHQPGGGGCGQGPEVPEPSTLAIFALASLCFLVKKKGWRLTNSRC